MIVNAVLVGLFKPILSSGVTLVNARSVAAERGIEVVESRSTRPRNYTEPDLGEAADERRRTLGRRRGLRARRRRGWCCVDGVAVEAPLEGTMIVICNNDQPGVIGDVGTILGRHGVNIANFALGRDGDRAIGVVIVDETVADSRRGARRIATGEGDPRSADRQGLTIANSADQSATECG